VAAQDSGASATTAKVAPVEVWALETLLHAQYERLEWKLD
jgi:hypothetical protein